MSTFTKLTQLNQDLIRMQKCEFTREEMEEQAEWTKVQGEMYGNPDQIVTHILWFPWIEKKY